MQIMGFLVFGGVNIYQQQLLFNSGRQESKWSLCILIIILIPIYDLLQAPIALYKGLVIMPYTPVQLK